MKNTFLAIMPYHQLSVHFDQGSFEEDFHEMICNSDVL